MVNRMIHVHCVSSTLTAGLFSTSQLKVTRFKIFLNLCKTLEILYANQTNLFIRRNVICIDIVPSQSWMQTQFLFLCGLKVNQYVLHDSNVGPWCQNVAKAGVIPTACLPGGTDETTGTREMGSIILFKMIQYYAGSMYSVRQWV